MSKLRVLYVASEINPFLQTSEVADFVRKLPQAMQEKGMEIRILVPRFGIINERKNRLHEVVRLSGINIAVGDEEKPLIIKAHAGHRLHHRRSAQQAFARQRVAARHVAQRQQGRVGRERPGGAHFGSMSSRSRRYFS